MLNITREELRADILEITTLVVERVVERVVDEKLTESNRSLRRMLSEDIIAVSDRVDRMDRRFAKMFKEMDTRQAATHSLLLTHITDPDAHNRPIPA